MTTHRETSEILDRHVVEAELALRQTLYKKLLAESTRLVHRVNDALVHGLADKLITREVIERLRGSRDGADLLEIFCRVLLPGVHRESKLPSLTTVRELVHDLVLAAAKLGRITRGNAHRVTRIDLDDDHVCTEATSVADGTDVEARAASTVAVVVHLVTRHLVDVTRRHVERLRVLVHQRVLAIQASLDDTLVAEEAAVVRERERVENEKLRKEQQDREERVRKLQEMLS